MPHRSPKENPQIQYLNYQEELQLRMSRYHEYPDLLTLFGNAAQKLGEPFFEKARDNGFELRDSTGHLQNANKLTFIELEDLLRELGLCGYQFFEMGYPASEQRFYKYMPLRFQPHLDELFEFAFHRELENLQYHIQDFLEQAHLNLDELNAIDLGSLDVTLLIAEKIAQALFMPAFELIKREYIFYAVSKIRKYNPHRAFHRLYDLQEEDKYRIMAYIRYILQGDNRITAGEWRFVEEVVSKLQMLNFDLNLYQNSLLQRIHFEQLEDLSQTLMEPVRRQVLGLVVDSAYSDKMLTSEEQTRVLEIAALIMGSAYHLMNS